MRPIGVARTGLVPVVIGPRDLGGDGVHRKDDPGPVRCHVDRCHRSDVKQIGGDDRPKVTANRRDHGNQDLVQRGFELILRGQPDELLDHLTTLKEHDRGNGADAVLDRDVGVAVGVDLTDLHLPLELGGELFDGRCEHLARLTPLCPEVHQHGKIRLDHVGFEVAIGELEHILAGHDQ